MAVRKYSAKKDRYLKLSEHFAVWEFQCHNGYDVVLIDTDLIDLLERLFAYMDARSIDIYSGYRTPEYSAANGGKYNDQHTKGKAADIYVNRKGGGRYSANEICLALEDMDHQGGIGRMKNTVHVDVRGYKCWFDELRNEKIVQSWYPYLGAKKEKTESGKTAAKPAGAKYGIDISHYENDAGKTDFAAAKAAGVEFCIIKAGYGRYDGQVDPGFDKNYSAAKAAGLPVGAYWYSYAATVDQARLEAQKCLAAIAGKQFEYPIYYDFEELKQFETGGANVSAMIDAFLSTVQAAGYFVGLYMSRSYLEHYVSAEVQKKYTMWVAEYASACKYDGQTDIWQYGAGQVAGFAKKNVDLNYCYRDFPTEIKAKGLNGFALAKGDLNGDGKVNSSDARLALRAAAKLENLTDAQKQAGDMDGDGDVDSADARTILRKAGKLE